MLNAQTAWPFQITAVFILLTLIACGGGGASKGGNAGTEPYTSNSATQMNSKSSANLSELSVNLSSPNSLSSQRRTSNPSFSLPTLSSSATVYDRERPSTPHLYVMTIAQNFVQLRWLPATDDTGIKHYKIVRTSPDNISSQVIIGKDFLTYTDQNLNPGSKYSYEITAYDYAENASFTSVRRDIVTPKAVASAPPSSTSSASSINPTPISISLLDEKGCVIRTSDAKIGWSLNDEEGKPEINHFEMRYLSSDSKDNDTEEKSSYITVLFNKRTDSAYQEFEYPVKIGDCGFEVYSVDKDGIRSEYVVVK